jgi:hypothetical protein
VAGILGFTEGMIWYNFFDDDIKSKRTIQVNEVPSEQALRRDDLKRKNE